MYICSNCGYGSGSWLGRCPDCEEWNSFVQNQDSGAGGGGDKVVQDLKLTPLSKVSSNQQRRLPTKLFEFDRVLGGGFVPGEALLLTGEPGVGKSTLLLQGLQHMKTLYISGEEGAEQIKERADRLSIPTANFTFSNTLQLEGIIKGIKEHRSEFEAVVIDSIQTVYSKNVMGQPGSVSQMREITYGLVQLCKETKIPMIIVGHVTKGGDVAGPKTLEHIVDAVFLFEGERISQFRVLRAQKNRFGSTDEIGIFEMDQGGLKEISDSFAFLEHTTDAVPGKAIAGIIEGKRPLFFEVQTLVVPTTLPMPRRVVKGVDYNKLLLLLAVMRKHLSLQFDKYDIYVNVIGGVDVKSPAADLAIAASLVSSVKNVAVSDSTVFVGELGLLGEIRTVNSQKKITSEAKRLKFKNVISSEKMSNIRQLQKLINAA
jgi:DNA repair protein RadA/Sms